MDTSWCQYDAQQEQRTVAGMIAANKISSVDYWGERIDVVEVGLNERTSVVLVSTDEGENLKKMENRGTLRLSYRWRGEGRSKIPFLTRYSLSMSSNWGSLVHKQFRGVKLPSGVGW